MTPSCTPRVLGACLSLLTALASTASFAQSPQAPQTTAPHPAAGAQAPPAATGQRGQARRFALIVGVNDGGSQRVPLRYAGRDAAAFAAVMTQLGGIDPADTMRVELADVALLRVSFEALSRRVAEAHAGGEHTEFMLFYSGHSDEQGLRLGGELLPYAELRALVKEVQADVRIAVVDSCASGVLTRLKGGRRRAPFLFDASSEVRGHAFLTSASGDEAAQESDRIGASFFTHYLVTGLRGAADFNSDGRVTLNEAYRFAFDETLARTERTQAGAQHPAYDIQLVGTGDLVMTELQATGASLGLPKAVDGRFFIRDAGGHLVAELAKPAGRDIELSLPPGDYTVAVDTSAGRREGRISLGEASTYALDISALQAVEVEANRTRGDAPPAPPAMAVGGDAQAGSDGEGQPGSQGDAAGADHPVDPGYRELEFAAALISPLDSNQAGRAGGKRIINHMMFSLLWGRTDVIEGFQLGGANHVDERLDGMQLAYALNSSTGPIDGMQLAGGVNLFDSDPGSRGVQLAGGANVAIGAFEGVQVAGGFSGATGAMEGVQVSGGVNGVLGRLHGIQIAGGLNAAGAMSGVQVGGVNLASAEEGLVQVGAVNLGGGDAEVVQVGAINTMVGAPRGIQVGAINTVSGRLRGVQVGVFNYAERAGAQLGLLSITPDVHADLWTSNAGVLMASLRFDADHTYSLLSAGTGFSGGREAMFGLGVGVKLRVPHSPFTLEADVSGYMVRADGLSAEHTPTLAQARVVARASLARHLSLFGGPTLNGFFTHTEKTLGRDRPGYGPVLERHRWDSQRATLWPGFVLGLGF